MKTINKRKIRQTSNKIEKIKSNKPKQQTTKKQPQPKCIDSSVSEEEDIWVIPNHQTQ